MAEDMMTKALEDVLREREKQDRIWSEQNHDPFCYLAILVEEIGEVAKAALHLQFGGSEAQNLRDEAVQTAAVALAFVECIDRDKWRWGQYATDLDQEKQL